MDKVLKQFQRIYADNGSGDIDFTKQEEELRVSQNKVIQATQELVRASENLNNIAISAMGPKLDQMH